MVDTSAVGATDDPFTMTVERGKIREFAKATMSENPDYLQSASPPIEPTFLTSVSFWSPPGRSVFSKVKMDLRRLLHGGQEYIFHGPPPHAGEELTVQTRVDEIYEKEGKRGGTMTFVVTVTEFRDASGNLRAEARSTAIETGQAPAEEVRDDGELEHLEVGRGPQAKIIGPLTRTDFVRYQGASGDFNPIHHDEEFAQSAGFPTVFSVGMLQAGVLATYTTDWLGADNVRRFGVQFREQVWPGDELELTGSVVEKEASDELGERTVKVELNAQRVGGGTAIKGWATFAVPE